MSLDLEAAGKLLGLVSLVISIASFFFSWFSTRRKDVERRFHEGSKRMDRHDLRLQALEQTVQAMPGKDEMHRVELQLSEIGGDLKAMSATMLGMSEILRRTESIVSRHEDHLRGDRQ